MGSKDAEVMKEGIIMKKLMTLALAAAMMLGAATGASAIDFKAKGQWIMSFDYGMHGNFGESKAKNNSGFGKHEDEFEARQRVRLQLDAVASEALSGTVFFEMGDQIWGQDSTGGALGADGKVVELKRAYIDWMVPQTDLKVRMGIQGIALPSFTTNASQIMDDDVAAISLNYQFNENVGLTAFWARPYNDNAGYYKNSDFGGTQYKNYMDNMDMFAVLLPLTFDGVKVTPWVMYAAMGPGMLDANGTPGKDFAVSSFGNAWNRAASGMTSGFFGTDPVSSYGNAFWAGVTGEVTYWDPFRIAWDVNYGSASYDNEKMNREGWLASLLLEYKLDWGTPGLYGWYGSGDDSNPKNGSERMPVVSANGNNGFSNFAFNGNPYIAREGVLGTNMAGTWGIGARLKDVSFLEDLKHTLRVNFMGGTNAPKMAKYMRGAASKDGVAWVARPDFGHGAPYYDPMYLTTGDTALEIGLTNTYKMYDNFTVMLDASYLALWLDDSRSTWGKNPMKGYNGGDGVYDAWNVNLSFVYSF